MQNETSVYEMPEIPADLLLYTHQGLEEPKELGDASVVKTMFGKARVRIVYKENNQSGWLWLLAAFAVLAIMAVVWLMLGAPLSPEIASVAAPPVQLKPQTPPVPQIPAPQIPGLNAPVQNVPVTHTPAPAAATAITAQSAIEQPVETEPARQAPAKKLSSGHRPKKPPVAASSDQTVQPQRMEQTDEAPARTPVSITPPQVTEPAIQITKTPDTANKPVHESGARTAPPAVNDQQPGQTGTQP